MVNGRFTHKNKKWSHTCTARAQQTPTHRQFRCESKVSCVYRSYCYFGHTGSLVVLCEKATKDLFSWKSNKPRSRRVPLPLCARARIAVSFSISCCFFFSFIFGFRLAKTHPCRVSNVCGFLSLVSKSCAYGILNCNYFFFTLYFLVKLFLLVSPEDCTKSFSGFQLDYCYLHSGCTLMGYLKWCSCSDNYRKQSAKYFTRRELLSIRSKVECF